MSKEESKIPTNRLSRFGQMASLATKIGSNVVAEGTKQWMKGNKPSKQELLPVSYTHLTLPTISDV